MYLIGVSNGASIGPTADNIVTVADMQSPAVVPQYSTMPIPIVLPSASQYQRAFYPGFGVNPPLPSSISAPPGGQSRPPSSSGGVPLNPSIPATARGTPGSPSRLPWFPAGLPRMPTPVGPSSGSPPRQRMISGGVPQNPAVPTSVKSQPHRLYSYLDLNEIGANTGPADIMGGFQGASSLQQGGASMQDFSPVFLPQSAIVTKRSRSAKFGEKSARNTQSDAGTSVNGSMSDRCGPEIQYENELKQELHVSIPQSILKFHENNKSRSTTSARLSANDPRFTNTDKHIRLIKQTHIRSILGARLKL